MKNAVADKGIDSSEFEPAQYALSKKQLGYLGRIRKLQSDYKNQPELPKNSGLSR